MKKAAFILTIVGMVISILYDVLLMFQFPDFAVVYAVLIPLAVIAAIYALVQISRDGDHLIAAGVLAIIFCGAIGGIFTIVYGVQVNSRRNTPEPTKTIDDDRFAPRQEEERKGPHGYSASDYDAPSSHDSWRCPGCGSINDGNFCAYCGRKHE